jgi:hypothetical protein
MTKSNFKKLSVALFLLLVPRAQAQACPDMPEGFHEWGAFGERSVYLYHFPMFGSIHSYQVLVCATRDMGDTSDSRHGLHFSGPLLFDVDA